MAIRASNTIVAPDPTRSNEDRITPGLLEIVRALASELHPDMAGLDRLGAESSIERDFWLDSLARLELALRVEQVFKIVLPATAIEESESIRDLARAVLASRGSVPATRAVQPQVTVEPGTAPAAATATTLIEALEWYAERQPARTHIVFANGGAESERITFDALRTEALAVAAGLVRRGIRGGDTVAIMLPTGREFFAAFYGVLYAEAIPVPLYPPARPSQIESHLRRVAGILANCEARILLTFDRARRLAQLLRSLNTRLESVATIAEIAQPQTSYAAPRIAAGDTAFLQYTSGSTGQPKGVVLTHANLLSNLHAMQRVTGVTSSDKFVSWLPLYHDMGLIGACFGALVFGYPLVLMSPFSFLSHPVRWFQAIHEYRATITAAPNFAYEICLTKINDEELTGLDLSSLRLAFNGAEAVSPHTLERFAERFAPYGLRREALMPVYGLAECAVGLTFPPVGRGPLIDRIGRDDFVRAGLARSTDQAGHAQLSVVSCGKPLPGHAVRIVDEGGSELAERVQGRIEFQGPSATSGYFHNAQQTLRLFDGAWLDTGDLGYRADGELYVTGRAKDIIVRGGQKFHPQELEEAVAQLPGVRKGGVAVFPAVDRRSGTERIVVLAETRDDDPAGRAQLTAQINRLAVDLSGAPIDEVLLAPPRTVLKTSSGKIRRAACREAYERGELGAAGRAPWLQIARLAYQALVTRAIRGARRFASLTWALRALLVSGCVAPALWLAVVLTPGLARRRRVSAAFVRAAMRLCSVRLIVRGRPPVVSGPHVYVANHASYLDGLVLTVTLPPDVAFVAKREYRGSRVIGRLLERLGSVFVERRDVHEAATGAVELQARLRAGESLAVFAEGTFRRDPGLLPLHMGAFVAAAACGAAVVPVAICGTRSMLPDGAVLPRPVTLEVVIGEPLTPSDGSWRTAIELRRKTRQHILAQVHEPDLEDNATGLAR